MKVTVASDYCAANLEGATGTWKGERHRGPYAGMCTSPISVSREVASVPIAIG